MKTGELSNMNLYSISHKSKGDYVIFCEHIVEFTLTKYDDSTLLSDEHVNYGSLS
jgi:hypothetical protein